jgi:hypothetical protein
LNKGKEYEKGKEKAFGSKSTLEFDVEREHYRNGSKHIAHHEARAR